MKSKGIQQQKLVCVGECLWRSESSNIYYARIKYRGKLFKQSLKTDRLEDAKVELLKLRSRILSVQVDRNEDRNIRFGPLSRKWIAVGAAGLKDSSRERRECTIRCLNPYFGDKVVRNITRADVVEWMKSRCGKVSNHTVNVELETLRKVFTYAVECGLLLSTPTDRIKRLKERKEKPIIPTREQFTVLLERMMLMDSRTKQAVAFCEVLAYSGMRVGEAREVRIQDIDFDRKTLLVTGGEIGTKNHEERAIPLFPALENVCRRIIEGNDLGRDDFLLRTDTPRNAMTTACKNGSLPHFSPHDLRHFFCSNAIECGVDFATIAKWLGHKDGGKLVCSTYGHIRDSHSEAMAKKMEWQSEAKVA